MSQQVFINLPVKDIAKTKSFFQAIGFTFNEKFSNEKAISMNLSENTFAMLLQEDFFKGFTNKTLVDASVLTEAIVALSADTKEEVDSMMEKALAAGSKEPREPQDHGFMYGRSFEDPDGHIWEVVWMEAIDDEEFDDDIDAEGNEIE